MKYSRESGKEGYNNKKRIDRKLTHILGSFTKFQLSRSPEVILHHRWSALKWIQEGWSMAPPISPAQVDCLHLWSRA